MTPTDPTRAALDAAQRSLDASPCRIGPNVDPTAENARRDRLAELARAVESAGRDLNACAPRHYEENHRVYVSLLRQLRDAEREAIDGQ